jgi:hypothetical protein
MSIWFDGSTLDRMHYNTIKFVSTWHRVYIVKQQLKTLLLIIESPSLILGLITCHKPTRDQWTISESFKLRIHSIVIMWVTLLTKIISISIIISLACEKWSQIVLVKGGERCCAVSSFQRSAIVCGVTICKQMETHALMTSTFYGTLSVSFSILLQTTFLLHKLGECNHCYPHNSEEKLWHT